VVADSERDQPLETVLVGGRESVPIVIAAYDPGWLTRFARERDRIAAALEDQARRIEHVGSTSVPGLGAKPIVDILVIVATVEPDTELVGAMERAGYPLRVREPGHRMFRTPERDVNIHVLAEGDPEVGRMLGFRDRRRASAADREAYEALKRALAERQWRDMNEYADAKGAFIEEVLGGLEGR
jgi:GrpB-like predicted nucleotidyltransferase (UPF0157 family)